MLMGEVAPSLQLLLSLLLLLASCSAAAASAACFLLIARLCSRRSSSSFISGLLTSRGLPLPKISILPEGSPTCVGTERGSRLSFGRPSGATSLLFQNRGLYYCYCLHVNTRTTNYVKITPRKTLCWYFGCFGLGSWQID